MQTPKKVGNNYPTKIMYCGCKHEQQDVVYGKQMRLHNPDSKGDWYRCTVCGQEK